MTYRMRRSLIKKLIYILLAGVAVYLLVLLFRSLVPEPPVQEIEKAREAIAVARDHNSVIYSPKIFREARSYYDSAMISWKNENERFILFRDYEKAREFAAIANKKALEATRATIAKSNSLKSNLTSEIKRLKGEVASFEKIFQSMPIPQDVRKKHARGKLLLKEAEIDLNKDNYVSGNVKITESNEYITDAYSMARKKLEEYFRSYSDWQDWAVSTITESRRAGSYAILIEKIPPRLHLYQGGKKKYTFEAEFGSNWIGDKKSRGDMATPEGKYQVTKKLSKSSTKYHKALMINYPNKQDVEEFNARIRKGQIPADSRIGDLIEIHGDGGKGGNWTQGCVALKNSDMDQLFKYVSTGTPVTIIGSTSTLEEFLSSR
jgi:L,D-peptidoglycan transpeptidase YkuD (ErfK/YbiS/YcfS/YnhG family)